MSILKSVFKLHKIQKTNKLFWDEISTNTEFLEFFNKNNFNYSISDNFFGLLLFYKIGIVDNTLNLYADIDDIENKLNQQYNEILNEYYQKFNFNIESLSQIKIKIEKYKLLKFNDDLFKLDNGSELDKEKTIELLETNLINNLSVNKAINDEEIFVYTVQYKNKYLSELLKIRKFIVQFLWLTTAFVVMMLIAFLIYKNFI